MSQQWIGFEWIVGNEAESQLALRVSKEEGAQAEVDVGRGFLPVIPLVVGAMLVVQLGGMIWRFLKDVKHGGMIVDAREAPLKIKYDASLDRGKVIVINAKGTTTTLLDASTKEDLASLVKNAFEINAPGGASAATSSSTISL